MNLDERPMLDSRILSSRSLLEVLRHMALRLTTAKTAFEATRRPGEEALELGRAALAANDLKRYRELLDECARESDYQRAYKARRILIELGLEKLSKVSAGAAYPLMAAVAGGALDGLEGEPNEPVLLNYAGIAFYEIGSLKPAEALFKAAARLDSDLPHVSRNLSEIARRRRMGMDVAAGLPANLTAPLKGLAVRAERVAQRAKPATGQTLSLCMIVKDEEEMLPRSLAAVKGAVDEIIVVDTGSTDRTVEIAESFGATVIHHEWTGDFAGARNVSFDAATSDWIIYLDADEVLIADDRDRLRELTGRVWREAFYLVETNYTGDIADGEALTHNALRVFRNRDEYRFEGRLHEQIAQTLPTFNPERIEASTVRIEHFGYLATVRDAKEKSRRNIELLEKQRAEGGSGPFLHFNLGSEYAASGQSVASLREFKKAWEHLQNGGMGGYGFVPSLAARLTKAYRVNGDFAGARRQADEGLEMFPGFTDLILEKGHSYAQEGRYAEAAVEFERCLELGDAPSKYSATVGCGTFMALAGLADARRNQGRRSEAVEILRRCLSEYPRFLGAVMPLAQAMVLDGADPQTVVASVEELVADITPSVRFMLGAALYEGGHPVIAESQFRAVLARQPDSEPVKVAIAESLLSQCRWAEAVEIAQQVDGPGYGQLAARSQTFAAIMGGDEAGYTDGIERARKTDVPTAQVALLEAWHTVQTGGDKPSSLPVEAAPLLATALEALLRVEEFDAFETLVALMDAIALPVRERQEMLAQIYFRRGYLESAADEWVAACQATGPDARALIGLAQVAYARELPEDAVTFASEAQVLDPGHAGAARLLAALSPSV
jgi:glycosyltransferase involved in cell wall biosynthesis